MCVDHTDGFVNGQTPIPVKTTSAACHGPAAAPGVEMSHRHLPQYNDKTYFSHYYSLLIQTAGDSRGDLRVRTRSAGSQLLSATRPRRHQPRRGSAARGSTAGKPPRHAGLPRAVRRGDTTVAEAHLRGKTTSCCSFANVVTSSSPAPTNVLLGNPSALKRAFESGGASLLLGLRNYLH